MNPDCNVETKIFFDIQTLDMFLVFRIKETNGEISYYDFAYNSFVKGHKNGDVLKDSYKLPINSDMAFSLRNELNRHFDGLGKPVESVSKMQGLLEATKLHLEDMRKLVFNK